MLLRLVLAAAVLGALSTGACGDNQSGTKSVTGVVFDVQSSSITELDGFSLHTDGGKTLVFSVAPEADVRDPLNGFVPGHLREHALTATRVKIAYRQDGDKLLAIRIEDVLT